MALLLSHKNYFTHNIIALCGEWTPCPELCYDPLYHDLAAWPAAKLHLKCLPPIMSEKCISLRSLATIYIRVFSRHITGSVWLRMEDGSLTSGLCEAPDLTASLSRLSTWDHLALMSLSLYCPHPLHPLSDIEAGSLMTPNKRASFLIIWVNYSNKRVPILVKLPQMI